MGRAVNHPAEAAHPETGSSLVEVVVALLILLTLAAGLFSMAGIALAQSENYGHLAARTSEYAQDKMEQLLVLSYGDTTSDTRVFPAAVAGGTGRRTAAASIRMRRPPATSTTWTHAATCSSSRAPRRPPTGSISDSGRSCRSRAR
jgi:hypothetical protein